MPAAYTITDPAGGPDPVTLGSIGARLARRELNSMAVSRVILEIVDATSAAGALFPFGTIVTIYRDDDPWFVGRVWSTALVRAGNSFAQTMEIRDAWQDIKDLPAQQPADESNPSVHDTIIGLGMPIAMEPDDIMPDSPNMGEEIARMVDSAQPLGGNLVLGSLYNQDVPIVPSRLNNPTIAEALQELSRTAPGLVSWFDYTVNPPKLNFRIVDSSAPLITLDFQSLNISSARIVPRDDLLIKEAEIRFLDASGGAPEAAATQANDTGWPAALRKLRLTIHLPANSRWDAAGGGTFIDSSTGLANVAIPDGLADALVAAWNHEYFDGQIVLKDDDIGSTFYLGNALAITGGPDRWASMRAVIIAVSEDILAGETTITIGLNPHAAAQGPRGQSPTAPAALNTAPGEDPGGGGLEEEDHDPLETYVAVGTNIVKVAPGVCGRNESEEEVEVDHTAPETIATIGLGGEVRTYLGVSFQPVVEEFSVLDDDGNVTTEHRPVGIVNVLTATIRTSHASAAQPAIVNYTTGAIVQNGVVYFLLGIVTWPGGSEPTVQVVRKGNFDLINIPPNRIYLRVQED